ncbi:MAG TPA: metallopeptidase family protein [Pseudomonadales bacterium]|nr:metallopeptidase family protein [Pseudomonadales bacterium]
MDKLNWKNLCDIASAEIEETLMKLPAPLREEAKQLPITFERIPNVKLLEEGIEVDTLGLFTGAEFAEKGHIPMPSQIILFLKNLWEYAEEDENAFREEIRTTFLHELGHFLGLDEDDLIKRGLE